MNIIKRLRKDGLTEFRPEVLPETCPPERIEQINAVALVREHYPEIAKLMLHPVNEGRIPPQYRIDLYKQGQLPGASDIIILHPGEWPYACIEMKRVKGGSLSKEQRDFLFSTRDAGGYAAISRGADAFHEALKEFIGNRLTR